MHYSGRIDFTFKLVSFTTHTQTHGRSLSHFVEAVWCRECFDRKRRSGDLVGISLLGINDALHSISETKFSVTILYCVKLFVVVSSLQRLFGFQYLILSGRKEQVV